MDSMVREETQFPGEWKSHSAMGRVDNKARPEETVKEMRGPLDGALLSVEESVKEPVLEVTFDGDGGVGLPRGQFARTWVHIAPGVAQRLRPNFVSVMGRSVRALGLSDMQEMAAPL